MKTFRAFVNEAELKSDRWYTKKEKDGTLLAYLTGDKVPFAKIVPPKLTRYKKLWEIYYRERGPNPWGINPNTGKKNLKDVKYEFDMATKHSTRAQFNLPD